MILKPNYTREELIRWIKIKLGGSVWRLEGMSSQNGDLVEAAVDEALMEFSTEIPAFKWEMIPTGARRYKLKEDPSRPLPIMGVIRVDFIEPYNAYGMGATGFGVTQNLVGVTVPPVLSPSAGGSGEIIEFMQWRKSFQRVTSRQPTWKYDDLNQEILIANPVNYYACVMYTVMRDFEAIRVNHRSIFKDMALANARISLGEVRSKFSEIKGPGLQSIGLDGGKLIDRGEKEKEVALTRLKGIRPRLLPFWD